METLSIAATVVSAVTSIVGGISAKQAADDEAAQYREEQENARVAGLQEETERQRELQRQLASVDAIRAGRGVELYSPTSDTIRAEQEAAAEDDINTIRLNSLNRQRRYAAAADSTESAGTGKLLAGIGGGVVQGGKAAMSAYELANRPGK